MTIFSDLIKRINSRIDKSELKLRYFQSYRATKRGSAPANYKFLNENRGFVKSGNYTYHVGGSREFQYNISDEGIFENENILRFGLAFSLEPSQSVLDPIGDQSHRIERFNHFYENNKSFFEGYSIWVFYPEKGRKKAAPVRKIRNEEIQRGNFIFIGKWINKNFIDIDENDLEEIVHTFEYLYPLYKLIQWNEPFSFDKRIMRLTWNTNNWEYPGGHQWNPKKQNDSTVAYENQYGYGHEEWLFNERFRIEGFQYGYIRGVNNLKEENKLLNQVALYTISNDGQRYLVGNIYNVEVIKDSEEEIQKISKVITRYKKAMVEELLLVNADAVYFENDIFLPNVKFKWEEVNLFNEPLLAEYLDSNKLKRYQAYKLTEEFQGPIQKDFEEISKFKFIPGKASNTTEYHKKSKTKETKVRRRHGEITDDLYDYLLLKGNKIDNISVEKTRVGGSIIDVAVDTDKGFELFEIKTSNTALSNIRQGIGQILEYAFMDGEITCTRLIIVGPAKLKPIERDYLIRLKALFNIDLEYWEYKSSEELIEHRFIKK